ncbi:hypothetical protein [Salipaludibacillus daqingensis]|uniref:hypothetical protein n=1 Tax=Salipaludibacillus daqingensis TaxID=3041001 RepID=UPI002476F22B|nr:hypothetical protein [Salipaludibacillus daqingensis]
MDKSRQKWMMFFSTTAFLIVFISSLSTNQWETSLFRAVVALVIGLFIGVLFNELWKWIRMDLKVLPSDSEQSKVKDGEKLRDTDRNLSEKEINKTSNHIKDLMNE